MQKNNFKTYFKRVFFPFMATLGVSVNSYATLSIKGNNDFSTLASVSSAATSSPTKTAHIFTIRKKQTSKPKAQKTVSKKHTKKTPLKETAQDLIKPPVKLTAMESAWEMFSNKKAIIQDEEKVKSRLIEHFESWKAVRYRWGGASRNGIDCSAFVQIAFREKLGIQLPRTTHEQLTQGISLSKDSKRKVGDLIFFKTSASTNHIGIYIGNNKFIHSASSVGVSVTDLDNRYWSQRYTQTRRVL